MKRVLANLSAFSMILIAATGCSKNHDTDPKPAPVAQNQQGDVWQLKLASSCQSGVLEQCLGGYGFTVFSDGHFEAGPGPDPLAQVHKGKIDPSEFKRIKDTLAGTRITETCPSNMMLVGEEAGQSLFFEQRGKSQAIVQGGNTQATACTSDPAQAETLHKAIRELAKANYPLPFPNDCVAAIDAIEGLYPAVQSCARNEDCEYSDIEFSPIPAGQKAFVVTQDCSRINPLVAANKAALLENQNRLLAARDQARKVCDQRLARAQCGGVRGIQADRVPAICKENVCQARSFE